MSVAAATPLIEVEHLTMRFGGLVAIDDVSFTARPREITAIIGPNGAGKTTVFNCITGFYKPTVGRLTLRGDRGEFLLERMLGHEIGQRAKVARTFQNIRLFPGDDRAGEPAGRTAQQADAAPPAGASWACWALRVTAMPRRPRLSWREAGWSASGFVADADRPAGELPHGAQRRLEIARAMCTEPRAALPRRARGRPESTRDRPSSTSSWSRSAIATASACC